MTQLNAGTKHQPVNDLAHIAKKTPHDRKTNQEDDFNLSMGISVVFGNSYIVSNSFSYVILEKLAIC